uniref:Glutathione peroxidase n=2 Tax=Brachionus koreanus TaxID=1199090 RepID=A0A088DKT1_9BILA|nr:glutathione peroxidase [Brachionus koreanus]
MNKNSTPSSSSTQNKNSFSSPSRESKKPLFFGLSNSLKNFLILSSLVIIIAYLILLALNNSTANYFLPYFFRSDFSTNTKSEMAEENNSWKQAKSIYEFSAKDIDGNLVELSKYKGRVVLIVNVACNCGFTGSNYPQLSELYKKHEKDGLSVLAFPCNQFGGQEPKPEAEIKEFIKQFDVKFDMFSKINVNGDNAHPLYKFLKSKVDGTFGNFIKWNFSKFLINKEGIPVKRYSPTTKPLEIETDILKLLEGKSV